MVAYPRKGHVVRVKKPGDPSIWVDVLRLDYMPAALNAAGQVQAFGLDWMDDAGDGTGYSLNPAREMFLSKPVLDQDGAEFLQVPVLGSMVTNRSGQRTRFRYDNDPETNTARQVIPVRVCAVNLNEAVDPTVPVPWDTYYAAMQDAIATSGYDENTYVVSAIPTRLAMKFNGDQQENEEKQSGQGGFARFKHLDAIPGLTNIIGHDQPSTSWLDPFSIIVNRSSSSFDSYLIMYCWQFAEDAETSSVTLAASSRNAGAPVGATLFDAASPGFKYWPTDPPHAFSENMRNMDDLTAWTGDGLQTKLFNTASGSYLKDNYFVLKLPKATSKTSLARLKFLVTTALPFNSLIPLFVTCKAKTFSRIARGGALRAGLAIYKSGFGSEVLPFTPTGWLANILESSIGDLFPNLVTFHVPGTIAETFADESAEALVIGDFVEQFVPTLWGESQYPWLNLCAISSDFASYVDGLSHPAGWDFQQGSAYFVGSNSYILDIVIDLTSGVIINNPTYNPPVDGDPPPDLFPRFDLLARNQFYDRGDTFSFEGRDYAIFSRDGWTSPTFLPTQDMINGGFFLQRDTFGDPIFIDITL
jgi:hypothetical protein